MDYGLKMYGLTELFKTGSLGGITNNTYNVGGSFYGGNYDAHTSTHNSPMGQNDPYSYMNMNANDLRNRQMNTPFQYDFNGVMDSPSRYNGSFNYMDAQNMGLTGIPGYSGFPQQQIIPYMPTTTVPANMNTTVLPATTAPATDGITSSTVSDINS